MKALCDGVICYVTGAAVSGSFLFIIGVVNTVILVRIIKDRRRGVVSVIQVQRSSSQIQWTDSIQCKDPPTFNDSNADPCPGDEDSRQTMEGTVYFCDKGTHYSICLDVSGRRPVWSRKVVN
jgi:hypothetical protein